MAQCPYCPPSHEREFRYLFATSNIRFPNFFPQSRAGSRIWSQSANWIGSMAASTDAETTLELLEIESPVPGLRGAFYGGGARQLGKQLAGAAFVVAWNVVVTSLILLAISRPDDQLMIGDDAAHGEEAYALWGDGEKFDATRHHDAARGGGACEALRLAAACITAAHLARSAEPLLRCEVTTWMLDAAEPRGFSMRKLRANWNRAVAALSWVADVAVLVLAWHPVLVVPLLTLHAAAVGVWKCQRRPRAPAPHPCVRASMAEVPDREVPAQAARAAGAAPVRARVHGGGVGQGGAGHWESLSCSNVSDIFLSRTSDAVNHISSSHKCKKKKNRSVALGTKKIFVVETK
ncbi:hypothetical protein SORBI_3003G400332 [Sorghum bicolor]|uniref:Ammonium transporter AmtB-like domain-containing protein n=1 Tax=Sorghum bicolor TaxID=4558 RepID=A0A1W0W144_SORBI|nr:hypothetical protein SORBI_3003G400332 [Sorghum bicolor]